MSVQGSSVYQQLNVRDAQTGRTLELDLNYPPPSENMALTDPLGAQVQESGHSQGQATDASDSVDDEVVVISPRKFAEARNNSRRNRTRRRSRVIEGLPGGAEWSTRLSEMTNSCAFSQLGGFNCEYPSDVEVHNKSEDTATHIPMPPVVPQTESLPEAPTVTCAICMDQMIEETSTKCGHVFCKNCIDTAIATQHKCPTCRQKLRKRDTFRIFFQDLPTARQ